MINICPELENIHICEINNNVYLIIKNLYEYYLENKMKIILTKEINLIFNVEEYKNIK